MKSLDDVEESGLSWVAESKLEAELIECASILSELTYRNSPLLAIEMDTSELPPKTNVLDNAKMVNIVLSMVFAYFLFIIYRCFRAPCLQHNEIVSVNKSKLDNKTRY